jgi:undecaprenyl-diphosphatase
MGWFEAIGLALIQGLTEFLPISSSAHLILPSQILGWEDQGLAFDVAVHVGTLLAIVLYFREEIYRLANAWFLSLLGKLEAASDKDEARLAWLIIVATIPAGIAGLMFDDFISTHLRSTAVIATTTIVFGLLLWFSDSHGSRSKDLHGITLRSAVVVGFSQALALIPGTSRSGITMTAALLLGFTREASAKFSFLLSIPLIAAAGSLKGLQLYESGTQAQWMVIGVASLVSFLSAYACIHLFLSFLERLGFAPFVIYRLTLGAVLLFLMFVA